jgi:hypothetical protein
LFVSENVGALGRCYQSQADACIRKLSPPFRGNRRIYEIQAFFGLRLHTSIPTVC